MTTERDPNRTGAPAVLLLDVGQGDASLIVLPGSPRLAIVVDCKDFHVVDCHLRDFGVERIHAMVFTHLDYDHIAGGLELVRAWAGRMNSVYVARDGRRLDDSVQANQRAKDLFDALIDLEERRGSPGLTLMVPQRGQVLASDGGWRVRLIAPFQGDQLREGRGADVRTHNEHSAIVRVERQVDDKVVAVLIGGDAPLRIWEMVLDEEVAANVFRIPHHGGALDDGGVPEGWTPASLYDRVGSSEAVVSVGTNNGHGHPAEAWRAPMVDHACRVRCTQVTPACHVALRRADERRAQRQLVLSQRGQAEPAWRHLTARGVVGTSATFREVPCAGTVAVALEADCSVSLWPRTDMHDAIVAFWAHPWCQPSPVAAVEEPSLDALLELLRDE